MIRFDVDNETADRLPNSAPRRSPRWCQSVALAVQPINVEGYGQRLCQIHGEHIGRKQSPRSSGWARSSVLRPPSRPGDTTERGQCPLLRKEVPRRAGRRQRQEAKGGEVNTGFSEFHPSLSFFEA